MDQSGKIEQMIQILIIQTVMMMIKPVRTLYRFLQPMWDTAREREKYIYIYRERVRVLWNPEIWIKSDTKKNTSCIFIYKSCKTVFSLGAKLKYCIRSC